MKKPRNSSSLISSHKNFKQKSNFKAIWKRRITSQYRKINIITIIWYSSHLQPISISFSDGGKTRQKAKPKFNWEIKSWKLFQFKKRHKTIPITQRRKKLFCNMIISFVRKFSLWYIIAKMLHFLVCWIVWLRASFVIFPLWYTKLCEGDEIQISWQRFTWNWFCDRQKIEKLHSTQTIS